MAWIQRSILGLIGCLMVIGVRNVAGASDTPAPYIYYYANTINAIVVERADGTDSRIIAPGAMPENNQVIVDLDWSPSGEWMAWRSAPWSEGGVPTYRGWIARTDGTIRLTLLDDLAGMILKVQWSPSKDLLFVARTAGRQLTLMIIDVGIGKIVAQTSYQSLESAWYNGVESDWINNGQVVYFAFSNSGAQLMGELTSDNQLTTRIYGANNAIVDIQNGRLFRYAYNEQTSNLSLIMEDTSSGRQVPFGTIQNRQTQYQVYWTPNMLYALIFSSQCPGGNCSAAELYVLDWQAGTVQRTATHIQAPQNDNLYYIRYRDSSLWSPDGSYAAVMDKTKHLNIVDVASGETFLLSQLADVASWQWVAETNMLIVRTSLDNQLYRFDLNQKKLTPLDVSLERYIGDFISPDGRYLGLTGSLQAAYDMLDLETGTKQTWPHHSLGASAGPILEYQWYPDSKWFMTGEMSAFASGGAGPSAVMILNTVGTVRRELSVCWSLGACAGFVPDRVLPHLGEGSPTSVIQQSEQSLVHDGKVYGVTWSPDENRIASYSVRDNIGSLNIWVVNGEPKLLSTYKTKMNCAPYPFPCRLDWSADGKTITLDNRETREVWDIETGKVIETSAPETTICEKYSLRSPDGHLVACFSFGDERIVTILDTADGQVVATLSDSGRVPTNWSGDSQKLFINTENGTGNLLMWDRGGNKTLIAPEEVYSADVRPDGKYIFGASLYHRIYVWDAVTGERLTDLNWYAIGIALSPDGTRLAAAGSSLVTIWDVSDLSKKGQ
ncbi:MAG: hypothetical protein ABI690_15470 [Chloroflexota bacterium]